MKFIYELGERIDTNNVSEVEEDFLSKLAEVPDVDEVELRAANLDYISSAGLRMLLKCRKQFGKVTMTEVSPEVCEILATTGFDALLCVQRRLREISIDGLQEIGRGANGVVYRLDEDRIVKVYNPVTSSLEKIRREKNASKQAFVHGIPCAISYDIVQVGDRYGMIYEMLNANTLGGEIAAHPDRAEEYARQMSGLLKKLHATEFAPGVLPDARENLYVWVDIAEKTGYYEADVLEKMRKLIAAIPSRNTFVHGDFHPGNIMVCDGELILIDMGDAAVGDPLIDMLGSYQIMQLVPQRKGGGERYTGMANELVTQVWDVFIRDYTGMRDPEQIKAYEQKLKYYALIRSFAGITFSELVPKEILPKLTADVANVFLTGYETAMQERMGGGR